jgi:DNA-binding NarL/FixJ family response regulator
MRVVIVGAPSARARLIARLPDGIEVVGESATLNASHEVAADAWLVAPPEPAVGAGAASDDFDGELAGVESLTARELAVLSLLALGLSNKSIATRLGISDQTVKFHVASICGKLGASNRTDAARRALRLGLIPL